MKYKKVRFQFEQFFLRPQYTNDAIFLCASHGAPAQIFRHVPQNVSTDTLKFSLGPAQTKIWALEKK